jgi:AcrR family transcriptional regulator
VRREERRGRRADLTRERILRAAVELADQDGLEAMSMRRIGQRLGVEAMSLYNHVAGKDDILDGVVDLLIAEIELPPPDAPWRTAIGARALAARRVVRAHPWAPRLFVARSTMSRGILGYMDGIAGAFLGAGFPPQLIHDATHLISSRMLGFTQDIFDPNTLRPEAVALWTVALGSGEYPSIAASLVGVTHDDEAEFVFGLELILDGLERVRDAEAVPQASPEP